MSIKKINNSIVPNLTFGVLLIGVILATVFLNYFYPSYFQRFLGERNPLLVISLSGFLGYLIFYFFSSKKWFVIYRKGALKKSLSHVWLVVVFTIVAIFFDSKITYPKDMNIPFPDSLLFYPTIGFLVEMLFHILPLFILLFVFTTFFKARSFEKDARICIVMIALLEPTFQIYFMNSFLWWAIVGVWINLFLFNLTQLFVFKKYDFLSMYFFRLIYYFIWHVLWGYYRLELLF